MVIALLMVSVGLLMGVVVALQTITIQAKGDFTMRQMDAEIERVNGIINKKN